MYEYTLIKRKAFHRFLSWSMRLATYGQWCSRADLSRQMMHIVIWTTEKGCGKTSMCLDLGVVCLFCIWKLLFLPIWCQNIMLCLKKQKELMFGYTAVYLGPFTSSCPIWQVEKVGLCCLSLLSTPQIPDGEKAALSNEGKRKYGQKKIKKRDAILRSQASTYEHFDQQAGI